MLTVIGFASFSRKISAIHEVKCDEKKWCTTTTRIAWFWSNKRPRPLWPERLDSIYPGVATLLVCVQMDMVYLEQCQRGRVGTRLLFFGLLKLYLQWDDNGDTRHAAAARTLWRNLGTRRQTCCTSSGGSSNKEKNLLDKPGAVLPLFLYFSVLSNQKTTKSSVVQSNGHVVWV